MNRKYLPSRQFVTRVIIIAIVIVLVWGIRAITLYLKHRTDAKAPTKLLIKDVIQKDTNNNGIPDWEETLWGLDPTKNGPENKEFIIDKRQTMTQNADGTTTSSTEQLTPNEELSREFFAVVMSLQETGNLDQDSLSAVSNTIGKKIVADPIADVYTEKMLTITEQSDAGQTAYFNAFKDLTSKYEDKNIGKELTFIAEGLANNDPQALIIAGEVGGSYRAFGQELIKIPVPIYLASTNLLLANDYEKVGLSLEGTAKMLDDPITGMKAIINYKKYSDALVADLENL